MNTSKIEEYDFVDCLLIDFGVDKLLSTLFVVVEAYYPTLSNRIRKKGLLKIMFKEINHLTINKLEGFDYDIKLTFDEKGNDYKANEVYLIEVLEVDNRSYVGNIESDMLNLNIQCNKIEITELT